MPDWYFEPMSMMGGAGIGAYRNTLTGAGLPRADLFAREVIQNSVDAARERSGPVKVVFREAVFHGEQLRKFRKALHLGQDSQLFERRGLLSPDDLSALLEQPLRVLYVEDFNTVGLGGTTLNIAPEQEDNYSRFCLQVGETSKEAGTYGGTFGFGKAVYWSVAALWSVVVYSRFRPTERTNGNSSRLIVVSWFNAHNHPDAGGQQVHYTGRAWYGAINEGSCQPLVDAEADSLARKLGFTPRSEDETGLSLLILGHQIELDQLRIGVEKNWWPRMLEGTLDVEIAGVPRPAPESNPDLARFIRSWHLTKQRITPTADDTVDELRSRKQRKTLGLLALTCWDPEEASQSRSGTDTEFKKTEIALVRIPGMVVKYLEGPTVSASQPPCQGVFLADSGIDTILAGSEPPAHNDWDAKTIRRDRALGKDQREIISSIFEQIRRKTRAFLLKQQEPPPVPPPRCRELEKLIGKYLPADRRAGPTPPAPSPDPFSIRFVQPVSRSQTGEGIVLDCTLGIAIKEVDWLDDVVPCRVTARAVTLLDDGKAGTESDVVRMSFMALKDPEDSEVMMAQREEGRDDYIDFLGVPGGEPYLLDLRSEPLPNSEYRVAFSVSVEVLTR